MKGGEKEGHVKRVGRLPDRQESHDKFCRMKHSRVMGPIIISNGSRNCTAGMSATASCLNFCSTVQRPTHCVCNMPNQRHIVTTVQ